MRKLITKCLVAASVMLLPTIALAEQTKTINTYNNVYYKGAIEKNGHLYIPIRDLFSTLKAPIIWNEKANSVKVYFKNTLIEYYIGSRIANVNNKKTTMDAETILIDKKVYIPLKDTAKFISSDLTAAELDQIQMKYFWGYTFEMYVLTNTSYSTISLPYGHYTVEDAWKVVDRYEGNYVHDNVVTEFKGMEGNYYIFHTYYVPEYSRKKGEVLPDPSKLMEEKLERFLWNRYLVHKETGELIVQ